MNLASDSPTQKSLRKRKRPPRQPTTKGKNNKGSLWRLQCWRTTDTLFTLSCMQSW